MEISNYNIEELIKDKEKLSEYIKKHEDIKNNLKEDQIKVSLLNIDSNYRNTQPKNINETNTVFLPDNPIITKKGFVWRLRLNHAHFHTCFLCPGN